MKDFLKEAKFLAQAVFVFALIMITASVFEGKEPWFFSTINFVFHEAGHPILGIFFGEVAGFSGGTLMQLFVPGMFAVYFFLRKEFFSFWVMIWWMGENMIGIARYISDARTLQLELWGGGEHDWNFLLSYFGMLQWDIAIGNVVRWTGIFIMIAAFSGAFFVIFSNKKRASRIKGDLKGSALDR